MAKEQVQMITSWVVLIIMTICAFIFMHNNSNAIFAVPVVGSIVFHFIRSDVPAMQHLSISEMSKPFQYYALLHYLSFSAFGLYLAIFKPELITYSTPQLLVMFFAVMFPFIPSAIRLEAKLYKHYGDNNA